MAKKAFVLQIALFGALLLGLIFLFFQNRSLSRDMTEFQQNLQEENALYRGEQDQMNHNLYRAASATNDLRQMLGMAPLQWNWGTSQENGTEHQDEALEDLKELDIFYSAVDLLENRLADYQRSEEFTQWITDIGLEEHLSGLGFNYRPEGFQSCQIYDQGNQLCLVTRTDQGIVITQNGNEQQVADTDALFSYITELHEERQRITARAQQLYGVLRSAAGLNQVQAIVSEKRLRLAYSYPQDGLVLEIRRSDNSGLEEVRLSNQLGEITISEQSYQDGAAFQEAFIAYLEAMDSRTEVELLDAQAEELINKAMNDQVFLEYLESRNMTLETEPWENPESDYRHWNLTRDGEALGSIGLLKGFGELYLLDSDNVPIQSFRGFSENHRIVGSSEYQYSEDFEVITDLYSSSSSTTFLLIGTHEKNADTMIIAHADQNTGTTHMVSIPRDLWYNNRKINSVYRYYGPEALVRELSELTGLTIDHYISVDMYAFVEVINIMGGIDIVLDEALIDPSYKIKENGQWTTLHYPAGPIHLDGLGALRVARSRHSTNDFDRAKRQQRVISAMKDKAVEMGLSDMDQLFQFISAAIEYTDTDMSAAQMLRTFLRFKDTDINMGNVIDNTNILYTSYSNLYELEEEERQLVMEDPEFNWGAWIVLPRNNDWNLIKWYFRDMITP